MFQEINNEQLQNMLQRDVVAFDIRREDEFQTTGIIEKTIALPFFNYAGEYDIEKWMEEFHKHVKNKDQEIVLICAHANRTKTVGNFLAEQMKYTKVYDLSGGIASWIQEGLQTVEFK